VEHASGCRCVDSHEQGRDAVGDCEDHNKGSNWRLNSVIHFGPVHDHEVASGAIEYADGELAEQVEDAAEATRERKGGGVL